MNFSLKDIRRVSLALKEETEGKEECSIDDMRIAARMLYEFALLKLHELRREKEKPCK
jgi:hypothetical protein